VSVRRGRTRVEVDMLLADGRDAVALLGADDWDWLELDAGDIVPGVDRPRPRAQRVTQDSFLWASVATRRGRRAAARFASVTPSSTSRMLVRNAIHTSCSGSAAPR